MTNRIVTGRFVFPMAATLLVSAVFVVAADLDARLPKPLTREVNFATDVKPILERSCAQCHTGEKPKAKFSVESRERILKGGDSNEAAIIPGQSGSSPLVHVVSDLVHEMEMPPLEKRKKFPALTKEEVAILRGWIDQGAKWPEGVKLVAAAGGTAEKDEPMAATEARTNHDPIFDMIRAGDRRGIAKALKQPGTAQLRDEEGNTPLIQAAFYLQASQLAQFIDRGADINATNAAGLTPLMKAISDLDKTRLLIQHGANVNAASRMGNTPLIMAAFSYGSTEVVKALIGAGANVNAPNGLGGNAVIASAYCGDLNTLWLLLDHQADPNSKTHIAESGSEASALMVAAQMGHLEAVKLLLDHGATLNLRTEHGNALNFAAIADRRDVAAFLLERGIEVNVPGQRIMSFRKDKGLTALMYACLTEKNDATLVKSLIQRGADLNAKASSGETALSIAQQRGNTEVVAALLAAGAKPETTQSAQKHPAKWTPEQASNADIAVLREAVQSSVSLMVKSGARMTEATGGRCTSCHQQTTPAMAWSFASQKGFEYPKEVAKQQVTASLKAAAFFGNMGMEMPLPTPNIAAWHLIGLNAAGHQPDGMTDKYVYTLLRTQFGDGRWITEASRAPTDYSDVTCTAAVIRALKLYAPPTMKNRIDRSLEKATAWLRAYSAQSTEERAMQILGLHWAGVRKAETDKLAEKLVAEQRADGGWAQLPTLNSDAYATGLVLNALKESGATQASDATHRRGVKYLLSNQLVDGSWWVKTRVSPVQVAIDDIFPHDKDQWISTIATGWASMALMNASETAKPSPKLTASK